MRMNWRCVAMLLVGLITTAEPVDPSGVDGFVKGDIGTALSTARIGIDSLSRVVHRETSTNSSGYYLIDNLESGGYSLWVEVSGHGCIYYPHITIFPGQRLHQDFEFTRTKKFPSSCEQPKKKTKT